MTSIEKIPRYFQAGEKLASDVLQQARKEARGLPTPPVAEFHTASKELQPRVSGSMLPTKEGSTEGAFTFEHIGPEGKRETSRLKVGDLLPHQLSFKTESYASPLSGDVGEVVAIGPDYADFEFVVPKTEQHPTGLLRTRFPIRTGEREGESPEEILQRKREEALKEAEMAALLTPSEWHDPGRTAQKLVTDHGKFKDFYDAIQRQGVFSSFLTEGDALGYAAEHGPYKGQGLSEKQVFEASEKDFLDSQDYDVVEERNVNGLEVVTFDDGKTYANIGGSSVNVTGHPSYDPFIGEQ